nr:MAG TPA_asm: hypothetical protein [Bacteriophage sp.]
MSSFSYVFIIRMGCSFRPSQEGVYICLYTKIKKIRINHQ